MNFDRPLTIEEFYKGIFTEAHLAIFPDATQDEIDEAWEEESSKAREIIRNILHT